MSKQRTLSLSSAAWRRLRATVLADEPLCRICKRQGRITPALEVDHIDNDPSDNRREALQSLCRPCHSRKTQADLGKTVAWGCGLDGMPLDPEHPWNLNREQPISGNRPSPLASLLTTDISPCEK